MYNSSAVSIIVPKIIPILNELKKIPELCIYFLKEDTDIKQLDRVLTQKANDFLPMLDEKLLNLSAYFLIESNNCKTFLGSDEYLKFEEFFPKLFDTFQTHEFENFIQSLEPTYCINIVYGLIAFKMCSQRFSEITAAGEKNMSFWLGYAQLRDDWVNRASEEKYQSILGSAYSGYQNFFKAFSSGIIKLVHDKRIRHPNFAEQNGLSYFFEKMFSKTVYMKINSEFENHIKFDSLFLKKYRYYAFHNILDSTNKFTLLEPSASKRLQQTGERFLKRIPFPKRH